MTKDALQAVLEGLSRSEDPLVAALAQLLSVSDPEHDTVLEPLSLLAASRSASLEEASALVSALVAIDKAIAATCPQRLPFATRLAPFCTQRLLHAALEAAKDQAEFRLAQRSPIVKLGRRTLFAAPTELVSREAVAHFFDRIILAAREARASKIILFQDHPPAPLLESQLDQLRAELEAVGARLVVRLLETKKDN